MDDAHRGGDIAHKTDFPEVVLGDDVQAVDADLRRMQAHETDTRQQNQVDLDRNQQFVAEAKLHRR